MSDLTELKAPTPIWFCKIGTRKNATLPHPADPAMRAAVAKAFKEMTGVEDEFLFSGWSAELEPFELAVVENRAPTMEEFRDYLAREAAPDLLEACKAFERGQSDAPLLIRAAITKATPEDRS